ncbi:MAG: hypothetical protein AAF989_05305 [Planctomycetota bacterium]
MTLANKAAMIKTAGNACQPTTTAGTEITRMESIKRWLPVPNGFIFRSAVGQKPLASERPANPAAANAVTTRSTASIHVAGVLRRLARPITTPESERTISDSRRQVTASNQGTKIGTITIATVANATRRAGNRFPSMRIRPNDHANPKATVW